MPVKESDPKHTDVKTDVRTELTKEDTPGNPVVRHLQRETANAFILYANYKHYHWQTFGPLFRDLHLMFDEFAEESLENVDTLAERLRMIGQDPVFLFNDMLKQASVHPADGDHSMRHMIEEADENVLNVIKGMRDAAEAADDQHDPGSNDLFASMVRIYEKQEWMLREILKKRDGLVS